MTSTQIDIPIRILHGVHIENDRVSTFKTEINGFLTSKLSSSNGSVLVVSLLLQDAKANNVNQINFFITVWGWYVFLIVLQTYIARILFELKLALSVKVAFFFAK